MFFSSSRRPIAASVASAVTAAVLGAAPAATAVAEDAGTPVPLAGVPITPRDTAVPITPLAQVGDRLLVRRDDIGWGDGGRIFSVSRDGSTAALTADLDGLSPVAFGDDGRVAAIESSRSTLMTGVVDGETIAPLESFATWPVNGQLVGFTDDGVLTLARPLPDPSHLEFTSWAGGAATRFPGLEDGETIGRYSVGSSDSVLAFTIVGPDDGFRSLATVDAATGTIRRVRPPGPCGYPVQESRLHDGALAWTTWESGSDVHTVCRAAVDTSGSVSGPEQLGTLARADLDVLPVGGPDGAVVLTSRWYSYAETPAGLVMDRNGSRALPATAHDAVAYDDGAVVSVDGTSLATVDLSSGGLNELLPERRLPAEASRISVDDGRVLVVDDGAAGGKGRLTSRAVGAGLALGKPVRSARPALDVLAREGASAIMSTTQPFTLIDRGGTARTAGLGATQDSTRIIGVSGTVALVAPVDVIGSQLIDTVDPTQDPMRLERPRGAGTLIEPDPDALTHGRAYSPGTIFSGLDGLVASYDVTSQTAVDLTVPRCGLVTAVQAAGPYVLAVCQGGAAHDGPTSTRVIDERGTTPAVTLPPAPASLDGSASQVMLGNGFAVTWTAEGVIRWIDLDAADRGWRPLASASGPLRDLDVSTGRDPLVGWVDAEGAATVARVPATGALPAPVTLGYRAPAAPVAEVVHEGAGLRISWSAEPKQPVDHYVLSGFGHDPAVWTVPGDRLSEVFTPSNPRAAAGGTITAVNGAGRRDTYVEVGRAMPPTPTNLRVSVDPDTSRVTVSWDYEDQPYAPRARYFELQDAYGRQLELVASDQRSASFVADAATEGRVSVVVMGEEGSSSSASVAYVSPGIDRTPPRLTIAALPAVTLTGHARASASATDRSGVARVEVRQASATPRTVYGRYSSAERVGTDRGSVVVQVTEGASTCVQFRAVDGQGNVGPWTRAGCTVRPLRETALQRSAGWRTVRGRELLDRAAMSTVQRGRTLSLPIRWSTGVWLIADTCPTCGSIRLRSEGRWLGGAVSLRSPSVRHRRLVELPWSGSGTDVTVVTTSRKRVVVDGLAVMP
ncbi:hypothetical protein KLP28_07310 [Nocardioidaceae bacterium]|nr:hypothetical protein KLP28_07310 [Nocardioidaceae bacterium]